jgi:hypothetical protein
MWAGCNALVASKKTKDIRKSGSANEKTLGVDERKTLFSFVPPTAGMFLWVRFAFVLALFELDDLY